MASDRELMAKAKMAVRIEKPSLIRRFFGLVPSKIIDARLVKIVKGESSAYKIEVLCERLGLFGTEKFCRFHKQALPYGKFREWSCNSDEEAIRVFLELCDDHGIETPGCLFF